jgi:hypothetical protein
MRFATPFEIFHFRCDAHRRPSEDRPCLFGVD